MRTNNVNIKEMFVQDNSQDETIKMVNGNKEDEDMSTMVNFEEQGVVMNENEVLEEALEEMKQYFLAEAEEDDWDEEMEQQGVPKTLMVFDYGKIGATVIDAFEKKHSLIHQESLEKVKEVYEAHYSDITGHRFEDAIGLDEEDLERFGLDEEDLEELQMNASCELACRLYAEGNWNYWRSLISELGIADEILDCAFMGFLNTEALL